MLIHLITGDESGDGHDQREYVLIESNFTADKISIAYTKGCEVIGFDFIKECCSDFEDNELSSEHFQKLAKYINKDFLEIDWMTTDYFAQIYLQICELGNPEFEYSIIEPPAIYLSLIHI